MFKVYSELTMYSIVLSKEYAAEFNHLPVSGAHLLLAILENPLGTAGAAWESCGLSRKALREHLNNLAPHATTQSDAEVSPTFMLSLKNAWKERLKLSDPQIYTGHILLGLSELECDEISAVFDELAIDRAELVACTRAELKRPDRVRVEQQNPDPNLLGTEHLNRLSPDAFLALTFAEKECRRFGSPFLGSEHLLIGLLLTQACDATSVGEGDLESVRREVTRVCGEGTGWFLSEPILSRRASSILKAASDNATSESSHEITLRHLRDAVCKESKGIAAKVRDKLGLQLA